MGLTFRIYGYQGMLTPPSTEMVCPVTNELSSDARNTAIPT
jgi:hypothetical protein